MEIRTKAEFFRLWEAGCLGNRLQVWRDAGDAYDSGVETMGLRQVGVAGGGRFEMTTHAQVLEVAQRWRREGRQFMICEAAPDEAGTIQGEVARAVGGWVGLLGPVLEGRRMRDSIRDGHLRPCRGAQVVDLLTRFMDSSSRDDLDALFELYPDATVEFTCYSKLVGALPGRNTIFWEVRNY